MLSSIKVTGVYIKTYSINFSFNQHLSGALHSLLTMAVETITSLLASTSCDKRTVLERENQDSNNFKKQHSKEGLPTFNCLEMLCV